MNQIKITTVAIVLALFTNATQAKDPAQCLETAYAKHEVTRCIKTQGVHFKHADAELNRTYKEVQKVYAKNKLFLKKLKKAQLAWIKLRDADFEMQFPHAKEAGYYGSIFKTCADNHKTEVTLQRVLFLKEWLMGVEEGDSCAGSKKRMITDDIEQEDAEDEMERVCYAESYGVDPSYQDVTELTLNINYGDGTVKGEYNYLPAEKDQRFGDIDGSMWKGAISAKYTYEQEGEKDSANLRIYLKDKSVVIKGEEKDKGLGLSTELKQTPCK